MLMLDLFKWRRGRRRIATTAKDLLAAHGDRAFFESHEAAWRAAGEGREREARFHRAVSLEISRVLQRRAILESIMAPPRTAGPTARQSSGPSCARRDRSRPAGSMQLFVDMHRVAR